MSASRFGRGAGAAIALAILLPPFGTAAAQQQGESAPAVDVEATRVAVGDLVARGLLAEAEDVLREAIHPRRDPRLLLDLGGVLVERAGALQETSDLGRSLRQGVLEEALELYVEAARADATAVAGATGAAWCHELLGRMEAAQSTLHDALGRLRESTAPVAERRELVRQLVLHHARAGEVERARAAIAEGRAGGELVAPGDIEVEELRLAAVQQDAKRAPELATAAVEAGADTYEVASLAWDAVGDGRLEELLNLYSKLLARKPDDQPLRFYRGATRLYLRDAAGAAVDLAACVDDPRLGGRARVRLGHALLRSDRPEEALAQFEAVLAGSGELAVEALSGLIDVAVQRARARKFADALALYERVLERDPSNYWARMGEPLCWKSLGDPEKAAAAYEAGLAALPEEPQLLNDYALLLKARGERAKAKDLFERALASGTVPAGADGGENLGIVAYRDERDLDGAARYFARTLLLDPSRPRIRFYRELCLCDGAR
jgi:tetratricopeptide (TPR) repeat protein